MNFETVLKKLKSGRIKKEGLIEKIRDSFNGYSFKGKDELIISSPNEMNCYDMSQNSFSAYINHEDAPIANIKFIPIDKYGEYGYLEAYQS
jgi:hypothetical protein